MSLANVAAAVQVFGIIVIADVLISPSRHAVDAFISAQDAARGVPVTVLSFRDDGTVERTERRVLIGIEEKQIKTPSYQSVPERGSRLQVIHVLSALFRLPNT